MSKNTARVTNFKYASELRKMGFKTAIHALPKEGIDMVDSLLEKNESYTNIANEIEKQFGKYVKDKGLKPISAYSVRSYKERWWKKNVIVQAIQNTVSLQTQVAIAQYDAETMLADFDALKCMILVAKKQKELIIDKGSTLDGNPLGMIDSNRDMARMRFFQMCKDINATYVQMGIVKSNPPPIKLDTTIADSEEDKEDRSELKERVGKLLSVINKEGKYGKHITGERVGARGSKK